MPLFGGDGTSDHQTLDVVGAFVDLGDAGVPTFNFGRILPDRALSLTSLCLGPRYRVPPYWLNEGVINPLTERLPIEGLIPNAVIKAMIIKGTYGQGRTGFALSTVDLTSASGATNALTAIDNAVNAINTFSATLGAIQNRFESTISNLQTTSENLSASRSRIQDTDFAAETALLTRAQILQQAGTAILAQANALPQQVLTLLK